MSSELLEVVHSNAVRLATLFDILRRKVRSQFVSCISSTNSQPTAHYPLARNASSGEPPPNVIGALSSFLHTKETRMELEVTNTFECVLMERVSANSEGDTS